MLHVYNKVTYLTIVLLRESSHREVNHCTMTGCAMKSAVSDCPVSYITEIEIEEDMLYICHICSLHLAAQVLN